eukprot:m.22645 g.22645  ORF g.22645 m.22645 type:complete len:442 (+) comp8875_c0_seq1:82-1407(+)
MSDERVVKQEADFSADVDEALPLASAMNEEGKLDEAVDFLSPLEKKSRIAADMKSTSRILVHIVTMCFERQEWEKMADYVVVFIKKRGQIKKAVTDMVVKVCEFIESAPDHKTTLMMIEAVRDITAGKIHVENERARLTLKLAHMKEEDGDVDEAAEVLQELQVETFGSMDRREKVEIILEQVRLCLARKDFIRAHIISKKISVKYFEVENTDDLKLKYFNQMLDLAAHDKKFIEMCSHFRSIHDTKSIKDDPEAGRHALQSAALYLILAPYDNEQSDLIARLSKDEGLEDNEQVQSVLEVFTTNEVIPWRVFEGQFGSFLRSTDVFPESERGDTLWQELKDRIVDHNIRVMAKYYTRMKTPRMAELLELTEADAERSLARLVNAGTVFAKIDRPSQIVVFEKKQDPNDILNDWSHNVKSLVSLVEKATHLINKERMVHRV